MKKILFFFLSIVSFSITAQRYVPSGGTSGQIMQIGSDGANLQWVYPNSSDIPLYFADAATTTSLSFTYSSGTLTAVSSGTVAPIDGYGVSVGTRILFKNQTASLQNGIYNCTSVGSTTTSAVFVRDTSYDQTAEIYPSQVNILGGTVNGGKYFIQTTVNPVVGTSPIVYITASTTPSQNYSVGENLISIYPLTWKNSTNFWQRFSGATTTTITSVAATGTVSVPTGNAQQFSGPSWSSYSINQYIGINTNLTYYAKIWAARTSGTATFYCGVAAYDENLNYLGYRWSVASGVSPSSTGTWYYTKISGEAASGNSYFPVGTAFIKPLIIVNYLLGGTSQVAGFEISQVPFEQANNTYDIAVAGTSQVVITPTTTSINNTLTAPVVTATTITTSTLNAASVTVTNAMLPVIQTISTSTITPDNTKNTGSYASSSTAFSIVNPSTTFADGQGYLLIISDNSVARAISFGNKYVAMAQALPTTTTAGKRMCIYMVYNSTYDKYLTWYSNEQ